MKIISVTEKENLVLKAGVDTSDILTDVGMKLIKKNWIISAKTDEGIQKSFRLKRVVA